MSVSQPENKSAYQQLDLLFGKIIDLNNAKAILSKDSEIAMPVNSADDRNRQIMALASMKHLLIVQPSTTDLLNEAEKNLAALTKNEQRNLFLMRQYWIHNASLPEDLVIEHARLESEGSRLHTELRDGGDWSKMRDWYEHSINILRRIGEYKKIQLGSASTYEALLDFFSPGLKDATVEAEFAALEKALPALTQEAMAKQDTRPAPLPLTGHFPKEEQEILCRKLIGALGFDFTHGNFYMMDVHPSCDGSASDIRFTVDYDESNFLLAVYTALHEGGHGLYYQNTPIDWRYNLAGGDMGMSIHESQSRIIEIQACHTPEFFAYLSEEAQTIFNRPNDPCLSAENLERLINRVNPSFIRVTADELTYPAHIVLRYKLEKALIEGSLSIDDMPAAWNSGMQKLLGITPKGPAEGHMQDVHWPCGYVGYFPAYTLGDMAAAQFFKAACKDRPELRSELRKGNFTPLREWLRDNVHGKGSLLTPEELFIAATGENLNAAHYLEHLSQRYLGRSWQEKPTIKSAATAFKPK